MPVNKNDENIFFQTMLENTKSLYKRKREIEKSFSPRKRDEYDDTLQKLAKNIGELLKFNLPTRIEDETLYMDIEINETIDIDIDILKDVLDADDFNILVNKITVEKNKVEPAEAVVDKSDTQPQPQNQENVNNAAANFFSTMTTMLMQAAPMHQKREVQKGVGTIIEKLEALEEKLDDIADEKAKEISSISKMSKMKESSLKKRIDEKDFRIAELESEIEQLEDDLVKIKKEAKSNPASSTEIKKLKMELHTAETELMLAKEEKDRAETELVKAKAEIAEKDSLIEQFSEAKQAGEDLSKQLDKMTETVKTLRSTNEKIVMQKNAVSEELQAFKEKTESLTRELEVAQEKERARTQSSNDVLKDIEEYKRTIEKYKEEAKKHQEAVAGKEKELKDTKDELESTKQDLNNIKLDLSNAKKELEDAKKEMGQIKQQLSNDKDKLATDKDRLSSEKARLETKITEIERENEKARKEAEAARKEAESARKEVESARKEAESAASARKELTELRSKLTSAEKQLSEERNKRDRFKSDSNKDNETLKKDIGNLKKSLEQSESERKQLEEECKKLKYKASHDTLTDVKNSDAFNEDLKEAGEAFVLTHISICNLKRVNGAFGRDTGDATIQLVAETLKEKFEKESIYRIYGDHFITLTKDAKENDVRDVIEEIRQVLSNDGEIDIAYGIADRASINDVEAMLNKANADRKAMRDELFGDNNDKKSYSEDTEEEQTQPQTEAEEHSDNEENPDGEPDFSNATADPYIPPEPDYERGDEPSDNTGVDDAELELMDYLSKTMID